MRHQIGLILLAAGGAARMGTPKQLLQFQGESLLRRAARCAVEAGLAPVVIVLGAHSEQLTPELDRLRVTVVVNEQWTKGMGTSIRRGMQSLLENAAECDAVVLMLGDQPLVTPETIQSIVAEYERSAVRIVASRYDGSLGVPALFDRQCFADLLALADEEGAKRLIADGVHTVRSVSFPGGALDVDTPQDYLRLIHKPPDSQE